MPPAEPSDAQAAYAIQGALVELRLQELERALRAHEAVRPIDWAQVSDLERIEVSLTGLVEFLTARGAT